MVTDLEKLIQRQREREAARALPRVRPDYDAIAAAMVEDLKAEHARRAAEAGLSVQEWLDQRHAKAMESLRRSGRNSVGLS